MKKLIKPLAILITILFSNAFASTQPMNHSVTPEISAMHKELNDSMKKMHSEMSKSMNIENPDASFAKQMIAHHEGAIDMANIELKYGKDPEMKKLAKAIIKAQEPEIKQMQQWLKKSKL